MNAVARRNRTGMEESRTLVLVATMRSPTIGSPAQTQKRAHCAKKHRPRRATAPDFPACAGVPRDHGTQNKMSSSQCKCRRDVINDMKLRIRGLVNRPGESGVSGHPGAVQRCRED